MSAIIVVAALSVSACRSEAPPPLSEESRGALAAGETKWIVANGLRIKTKVYTSTVPTERVTLVVALHGDAPNAPPSIHDVFAQRVAELLNGTVAVGVLRPGYSDGAGDRSDGERGRATGDNYTAAVVDAITELVGELKTSYAASTVVMVGHSGGAAIVGNILGRSPSSANAALLVACPCNVPAWRRYMLRSYLWPYGPMALVFGLPTESLSPLDLAPGVSNKLPVRILVGDQDAVAPVRFSEEYAEALRRQGVDVHLTIARGLEHNIYLEPVVFDELSRLVQQTGTRQP
jgi:pimeloyl-ACP methyl ester carboxylesterase